MFGCKNKMEDEEEDSRIYNIRFIIKGQIYDYRTDEKSIRDIITLTESINFGKPFIKINEYNDEERMHHKQIIFNADAIERIEIIEK